MDFQQSGYEAQDYNVINNSAKMWIGLKLKATHHPQFSAGKFQPS